jgi:hypothetical protein
MAWTGLEPTAPGDGEPDTSGTRPDRGWAHRGEALRRGTARVVDRLLPTVAPGPRRGADGTDPEPSHGDGAARPTQAETTRALRKWTLVGLVAACSIVVGAVVGGRSFVSQQPGAWFFGTPGGPLGSVAASGRQPSSAAMLAVYGGLVLMARAWLGLLRTLWLDRGVAVRRVIGVLAVWALPFLLAPPLFSRDVYSYAGQGEMVSHHIDPYVYGPGVLGATPFSTLPGPLWADTPSPYGPTFLSLDGLTVDLSGHNVLPNLVLLRLLELGGLVLAAAGLPTLARAAGRDPAAAVALGVGSPLALTTLLGGAHNDALMVGLLVAGLAVARRVGAAPGIVLCAAAAGVKAPAVLGVVFLGWNWAGPRARAWTRAGRTALAGAIAVGTLAVISTVSGLGWGWLHTVTAPGKVFTGVTPVDAVARVVSDAGTALHLATPMSGTRTTVAVITLVGAGVFGLWMLLRSPRTGTEHALGLTLLVLALCSPILWPWYLMWGLVVLAPVAGVRLQRVMIALAIVETLIGAASVSGMTRSIINAGALNDLLVVLGLAALALLPLDRRARAVTVETEPGTAAVETEAVSRPVART